ncbi:MAG TPA: HAMP domain-containing sensor histidine kinase [Candidatus Dormibacteraeota bacterium]
MVGVWAGLLLAIAPAAAPASLLPSPLPLALPSPLPLPSLPPILPQPSPSPSPAPPSTGGQGSGKTHGGGQGSSSSGFGSSGILSAFSSGSTTASAANTTVAPPPTPGAYQPAAPPPAIFNPATLFPQADSGNATESAVLSLLGGLLLVSLGLWLMAMRHRREALEAASLERTKTDFLNLASHELRGPLTVLKGYMSTAREGHFGQLPKEFAGRMPIVQNQLARMEMLVEQMLETARLDAGHPDVQRHPADLRRVVQNALPAEIIEGSGHHVEVEAPLDPVFVDIDEKRIEQVLHNLVDNALKYSATPATVKVRVSSDYEATARVAVEDHGHGIPPDQMGKLFSRFGRLVTEENSHVPGVGLGLYLGREVARRHGGDLTAISEPGQGSTFTLSLPLHHEDGTADPARPADNPADRALRWFGRLLPNKERGSAS